MHRFTVSDVLVHNCGFGGGLGALQNAAGIYRIELEDTHALRLRDAWRQAHPCTVHLWRSLMDGWMAALRGRIITTGRLVFRRSALFDGALEIVLPSGRPLVYHGAGSSRGEFGPEGYFMGESTTEGRARMWQKQKYYGGRATENCAQAISFDLMSDAMVRLHDVGYHTVLTTHDELALEVPESRADLALETMREIMVDAPAWAEGLPLAAGGWIGTRYRKE